MLKIYKSLLILLAALTVGVGLSSCRESEKPDPEAEPSASVIKSTEGDAQFKSTSAKFSLTTNGIEDFVYVAVESALGAKIDPDVVYAEAKEKIAITSPKQDITVYGLEGGKTYSVYFVFKVKGESKLLMQSVQVTTPAYTQVMTIVELGYNFVRVHIDVPNDSMYYYWIFGDRAKYEELKHVFRNDDMLIVSSGEIAQGDTTFYLKDGDIIADYGEGDVVEMNCKPGMTMYGMIAQCDSTGYIDYTFEDEEGYSNSPQKIGANRPTVREYTEKVDDPYMIFNGVFARQFMTTRQPTISQDEFKIIETITESRASFAITPPSSVLQYGVNIFESWQWERVMGHAGQEGIFEVLLREMPVKQGAIDFNVDGLIKDTNYKIVVIGMCNEDRSVQVQYVKDFKTITSSKPIVEVDVKHVENPEKNPFFINFNVKAKVGKVTRIKWMGNYVSEWNSMLSNLENTVESMMKKYGNEVNSTTPGGIGILNEINSAAGYTFGFNTWENRASRIVIQTFNEDDKPAFFSAEGTSLTELPKDRVESSLFESLLGDWTATITFKAPPQTESMTSIIRTTIAKGPEGADPKFFEPGNEQYQRVYNYYFEQGKQMDKEDPAAYAVEQITKFHKEFVDLSAIYQKKYRDQNRLVMRNVQVNSHESFIYRGAWDLFCDPTYSSYNTDEIFFDYGPKMFIEIGKDGENKDKLWVPTNPTTIPPFQSYSLYNPNTLIGSALDNDEDTYGGNFDVTVVDKDNLKIAHKLSKDNTEYLMSFYTVQFNIPIRVTYIIEDITLKRGFRPIEPQVAHCAIPSSPKTERFVAKRTAFRPSSVPDKKYKQETIKLWSYDDAMKNSAAYQYFKKRMK